MRDNPAHITPYRIAIVTLDSHNARPCERALENMCVDYPGLEVDIFAAATWSDNPNEFDKAKEAIMQRAGVTVAINSDDAEMSRRLNQEAAKTVKYGGMSEEEAWKMVTINPAKLLHLDQRVGSIKVGKDADLVLWNAHPLAVYAMAEKTMIEGAIYFDKEMDLKLRQQVAEQREMLIQQMLDEKNKGRPTQLKSSIKTEEFHCDTL